MPLYFGTLCPWHGRWYASVRKKIPCGVRVISGHLFDEEQAARSWLLEELEPLLRGQEDNGNG